MTWAALAALGALAALPALRERRRAPRTPGPQIAELPQGNTAFQWHGPPDGPVVVCVHGLTSPSVIWGPLVARLTGRGYRVLTYDLYGRGGSDAPKGTQDPGFFTVQLANLLAHEHVTGDITLIGYSMGGAIATEFAYEQTHRLRRLILLAPAGMGQDLGPLCNLAPRVPILGDWLFHMAFPSQHRPQSSAAVCEGIPTLGESLKREATQKGYTRSVLSSIRGTLHRSMETPHRLVAIAGLPVTAIWGRDDPVIPLVGMDKLTAWNPSVRHHIIDGADHALPYSHPDQIADLI